MRVFTAWVCFLLAFSSSIALGKVSIKTGVQATNYVVHLDGVDFQPVMLEGNQFVTAKLVGAERFGAIRYDIGRPELPVVRFLVDGDVSVEVPSAEIEGSLQNKAPIRPSQPSWSKSQKNSPKLVYDRSYYANSAIADVAAYEIETVGSFRGVPRRMVTLNALRYNAATGAYRLTTDYKVTVKSRPVKTSDQLTMAIISGAQFADSPALARLVEMKKSQGYNVKKLSVGTDVDSSPVAIREALRSIYLQEANLRFAVLVGDVEDVPSYESEIIYGVTDHYYRAIDLPDYEADINGPDIGVGRLSVNTESQLEALVHKIEKYGKLAAASKLQDHDAESWKIHPAFIATHDRYQVAEATHNAVIAQHFAPRGYLSAFPNASEKGGDKLYPISLSATKRQIVSHMADGRFIINFSGHGSYTGWEDVTTADVLSFTHPTALPWVLSNACITGDFREEQVFGETWLRHPNGAIVFWGSMDSSYWDEDDILERAAYGAVFTDGIRSFDLIHQAALAEVWRYYGGANRSKYYRETYVTFGDPSLELRLGLR